MPNATRPPSDPPPPAAVSPPANEIQAPPVGFPHHSNYLPAGRANSISDVWPMAEHQLNTYVNCHVAMNRKLAATGARLPDVFGRWWVRNWADAMLFHSDFGRERLGDIQALYHSGRRLDRVLFLSDISSNSPDPEDAEFTYYNRPLLCNGGRGDVRAMPFAGFGHQAEDQTGFLPVSFPRSPAAPVPIAPRLSCEGFLEWAAFLVSPEPLTQQQIDELGHVGCSEVGVEEWCHSVRTHAEHRRRIASNVLIRLQDDIIGVSDQLEIAVITVPREGPFRASLNVVSEWLVRARTVTASHDRATTHNQFSLTLPNTISAEHPTHFAPTTATREPITVAVNYDNFSPFTLPPCGWELEGRPAVTPTVVNTFRDLLGHIRSFARAYHADVADLPDDVTTKYYQIQIELNVAHFRRGIEANSWFDRLRTILRTRFDAEPSGNSLNQLTNHICQESGLTVAQAENLTIEEALMMLLPKPALETVRPKWDAETRTLTVGIWKKSYRKNATSQIPILDAFEAVGWIRIIDGPPMRSSLNTTVRDLNDSLGSNAPIAFAMNGNGTGATWEFTGSDLERNSPEVS